MEIIETIPIYGAPAWTAILFLVGLVLAIFAAAVLHDTEYVGIIIAIIAIIIILVGLISGIVLRNSEFNHNEYIVRITNMPTQEFIEKYEVIKRFEYSDAIQVREIEK